MHTVLEQHIYGITASGAAEKVFHEVRRLEELWNCFDPASAVSYLNSMAGTAPVKLDSDTVSILKISKRMAELTGHAFDITILPIVQTWRRAEAEGRPPESAALESALSASGSSKIQILSDTEVFLPSGQAVDLGGIAKGYAADRAREIYLDNGIKSALVNFGGNVLALGSKPDGSPWRIGIQEPHKSRGDCFGFAEVSDCSVVTSGSYERYYSIQGQTYSHIIDLKTGWTADSIISATVIADSSAEADALATAAVVLGQCKIQALFNNMEGHQIITLDSDGRVDLAGQSRTKFIRLP